MSPPYEQRREVKRGNAARVRELLCDGAEIDATDRTCNRGLAARYNPVSDAT